MVIKRPDNIVGYMLQTPEEYQGGVASDGGLTLFIRNTIFGDNLIGPFHLSPHFWLTLTDILYTSRKSAILHADVNTSPAEVFDITQY